MMLGAIEAGGTKFVCAVGTGAGDIRAQVTVPTTRPDETLAACLAFFQAHGPIARLGIAAFGPLDLNPASPSYGHLLETPKAGWSHTDIAGTFARALKVPVMLDTDVNGAVLAEHRFGAARGIANAVYVTVGTGIGGGALVDGKLVHGLMHPEIGHMAVPRAPGDEHFDCTCPFHDDCLEGLASGPAMRARAGKPAEHLAADAPDWAIEAHYLAQMCRTLTMVLSPERIILGGGVMAHPGLIDRVRIEFDRLVGGYLPVAARTGGLEHYILLQSLGGVSGLAGAFALADTMSRHSDPL